MPVTSKEALDDAYRANDYPPKFELRFVLVEISLTSLFPIHLRILKCSGSEEAFPGLGHRRLHMSQYDWFVSE